MRLWEVGFDMDEFTRFCMAETEDEAKTKFIAVTGKTLDGVEDLGWEKKVWATDLKDRWIDTDVAIPTRYAVTYEEFGDIADTLFTGSMEACSKAVEEHMKENGRNLLCEEHNYRHYDFKAALCLTVGKEPGAEEGNYLFQEIKEV